MRAPDCRQCRHLPRLVEAAAGQRRRASPSPALVGSSDSAAPVAKYLLEIRLGLVLASVGPSVGSIYGGRPQVADALFLAISQSGRSPDLIKLAQAAREEAR